LEAQQRYERHYAVAAQAEADAAIGLNRLTGDEAKSARHMLRKLRRDSKKDYDEAIAALRHEAWGGALLRVT
jgi:hypothetical protein